jgi:hypothetical protein
MNESVDIAEFQLKPVLLGLNQQPSQAEGTGLRAARRGFRTSGHPV